MRKAWKKWIAGALTAAMALSVASAQMVGAAPVDGAAILSASAVADLSDQALANSMGLGAEPNSLMKWMIDEGGRLYVNTYSGNLTLTKQLFQNRDGEYPPMNMQLTYNSQDDEDFGMGPGFRTNYNQSLIPNGDGSYTYIDGTGTRMRLTKEGSAVYGGKTYYLTEMEYKSQPVLAVQTPSNLDYYFDIGGGKLLVEHGPGMVYYYNVEVEYNSEGNISAVVPYCYDQGARRIVFHYVTKNDRTFLDTILRFAYDGEEAPQTARFISSDRALMGMDLRNDQGQQSISLGVNPETRLLEMLDAAHITYSDTAVPKVTEINTANSGSFQYLYGHNQTLVTDESGLMQLRNFNQDGVWVNP